MVTQLNDAFFREALNHTNVGLIITDPNQDHHPIIFANKGYANLTGYEIDEVIGKNGRLLQGEETDPKVINTLKQAIKAEQSITVEIYNYKKNGEGFWNKLTIDPMWVDGKLYYVGVQKDITETKRKEKLLQEALTELEELSTPIVPIDDHIVALPLIGKISQRRFELLTEKISNFLSLNKNDYLILDLSGLLNIEPEVVDSFLKLQDLTQIIGTQLVITGVRPDLALKARHFTHQLIGLKTYLTIQDAIKALS
ncbi:PAS domain-containing protein [Amphibacillus xylanus]|uniref:Putative blue-light photoreceptor n=1 Tax=Amphibacillus xylanus (strain ATCC 51415 / DSM 6626 / JCM 7361 / LMG 17667 / NBRC 15112 / Ep01) TaxID=698758 RepID=K0IVT6_AMPXN|nr:PAS domain-containing protein [Amphibacillus xylanus]BAM46519.1 putative blue-light photoreceptor [Amphibacillus xylanus NBRC 15112]